jgi:hypothetical protein
MKIRRSTHRCRPTAHELLNNEVFYTLKSKGRDQEATQETIVESAAKPMINAGT